jgi:hypothetical protein
MSTPAGIDFRALEDEVLRLDRYPWMVQAAAMLCPALTVTHHRVACRAGRGVAASAPRLPSAAPASTASRENTTDRHGVSSRDAPRSAVDERGRRPWAALDDPGMIEQLVANRYGP